MQALTYDPNVSMMESDFFGEPFAAAVMTGGGTDEADMQQDAIEVNESGKQAAGAQQVAQAASDPMVITPVLVVGVIAAAMVGMGVYKRVMRK